MDGLFRFGKDVGSPFIIGHPHHFYTLLGVENLVISQIPAVHSFLCCAERLAHHFPLEHARDNVALRFVVGVICHLCHLYSI